MTYDLDIQSSANYGNDPYKPYAKFDVKGQLV